MKRFTRAFVLGLALAASATVASADTASSTSSGSFMDAVSNWFYCTFSNQCVTENTTTDPTIRNKPS